jgi:excisionase family DNA binding protein
MRRRAVSITDRVAPERLTWAEARRAYWTGWYEPDTERAHLRVCHIRLGRVLPDELTLGEAAWLLVINRWTARQLVLSGRLPGKRSHFGERLVWRIPTSAVKAYARERQVAWEEQTRQTLWDR